ncbi:MAG: SRPBCC family protein [Pseudomonadota bacterium]
MDRQTELTLIDELLALKETRSAFLDNAVSRNSVDHYLSIERFQAEQEKLFQRCPNAAAHVSELPEKGSFLRCEVGGLPVLITRDKSGGVNAFLNVCRHRGTRLVDEASGCKQRFSCPYHAWTYSSGGDLIAAPHLQEGFPGIDVKEFGLRRLNCIERFGFIWVWSQESDVEHIADWFDGVASDLDALEIATMKIAAEDTPVRDANWKLLVEGGIEAYHFRVAHRKTIGPHFEDNLSTYRMFNAHMRSVLPRTSMRTLTEAGREAWRLRDHANVLYTLFPSSQLLVMQDHIVWVRTEPLSPSQTRLRLATLAPTIGPDAQDKDDAHWRQNHQITMMTLDEDFTIGESIQANCGSGANATMVFGRFEGALGRFNDAVESALTAP